MRVSDLSAEQLGVFDAVMAFMKTDDKRIVIGGYAGTGKSTLSKVFAKEIGKVHYCAFTGKAANVLREKGNKDVSTVHGAAYKIVSDEDDPEPSFELDYDGLLADCRLAIVDEYSMLSKELIDDIEKVADKVLYLGDPFQLPPVNGDCSLTPDYFLTEIHRQALESPILRYATDVREGREISFCDLPEFKYGPRSKFHAEDYEGADQIIVGFNKTRIQWNNRFREKLGFAGKVLPCAGDKLICIKNNHAKKLFNGMIGYAEGDARQVSFEEMKIDFDGKRDLSCWDGTFKRREKCIGVNRKFNQFDFGYAITCHKAQGSEFDDVLIYSQPIGSNAEEKRRWLYTAITRGKKTVKLIQP